MKIIEKAKWKYWNSLFKLFQLTHDFSHSDAIIVFGSGRSGTTYLANILSSDEGSTLIDEPLKNANSYKIDKIGFSGWGQYIKEDDQWNEAFEYFNNLLSGKEFNPNHTDGNSSIFKTKRLVFKFIRANLLMPWILNNYKVRKPIYLIRNPYAVICSRLKHPGWGLNKKSVLDKPIEIPNFINYHKFYSRYQKYFKDAKTLEEVISLGWVLENEYVLTHKLHNKEWCTVIFEDLLKNPIKTLENISQQCGFQITDKMITSIDVPSKSTSKTKIDPEESINGWKYDLSDKQLKRIQSILSKFGMD